MEQILYFRLEYNEKQGNFHCEWEDKTGYVHPENTNGWQTIAYNVPDPVSMRFTEAMLKKYPILMDPLRKTVTGKIHKYKDQKPSVETIKKEFLRFDPAIKKLQSA